VFFVRLSRKHLKAFMACRRTKDHARPRISVAKFSPSALKRRPLLSQSIHQHNHHFRDSRRSEIHLLAITVDLNNPYRESLRADLRPASSRTHGTLESSIRTPECSTAQHHSSKILSNNGSCQGECFSKLRPDSRDQ
jgi:hypothetical protein